MLQVLTPDEVHDLIQSRFSALRQDEIIPLNQAAGRVLARKIAATEYVPDFDRSTVDGYAVRASDTFGCSDAIPATLPLSGEVRMGAQADTPLSPGTCVAVPTGGAVPPGADCVVMVEYAEDYGDGSVGILKPGAPGMNLIFRGDDVFPGKPLFSAGKRLSAQDVGALAAAGITELPVSRPLRVGVISTGDELVDPETSPRPGQVRDVNTPMLSAMVRETGAIPVSYGIQPDVEEQLSHAVSAAVSACDAVIISGGSSVGVKDATCRIIEAMGSLLFHGIAIKPGKPTILGISADGKPLVGLPGHPAAAFFVMKLFILPLLARLTGQTLCRYPVTARLSESVGANHGRAQVTACRLRREGEIMYADPVRSQSGLITQLSAADGYFLIPRDCEGKPEGAEIQVTLF